MAAQQTKLGRSNVNGVSSNEWHRLIAARELSYALQQFSRAGTITFRDLARLALDPKYRMIASKEESILRATNNGDQGERIVDHLIVYGRDNEVNANLLNMPRILEEAGPRGNTTAHMLAAYGSEAVRTRLMGMNFGIQHLTNNHGTSVRAILEAETQEDRERLIMLTTH